jgi:hypothetical protein
VHAAAFWGQPPTTPDEGDWAEAVPRALRLRHARNVNIVLHAAMLLIWPEGDDPTTPFRRRVRLLAPRARPRPDADRVVDGAGGADAMGAELSRISNFHVDWYGSSGWYSLATTMSV